MGYLYHFFRDLAQKSASLETSVFVQCYTLILVHATAGLDYLPAPNFWSIPWHQTEHQSISPTDLPPSVLWSCWLGGRKGIRPVKNEWWGTGMVICLERDADLHMAQLMPLPLTVACFCKIQIGFTFLVLEKGPSNGCVCVCDCCMRTAGTEALRQHLVCADEHTEWWWEWLTAGRGWARRSQSTRRRHSAVPPSARCRRPLRRRNRGQPTCEKLHRGPLICVSMMPVRAVEVIRLPSLQTDDCLPLQQTLHHFIFRSDQRLKLLFETKVWDLINMQNILNPVSQRASHLTCKCRKKY